MLSHTLYSSCLVLIAKWNVIIVMSFLWEPTLVRNALCKNVEWKEHGNVILIQRMYHLVVNFTLLLGIIFLHICNLIWSKHSRKKY